MVYPKAMGDKQIFREAFISVRTFSQNGGTRYNSPNISREITLNGTNQYASFNSAPKFIFGDGLTDKPFSITAWINMTVVEDFKIATKGVYTVDGEYRFGLDGSGRLFFQVIDHSVPAAVGRRYATPLTNYVNKWVHVASTYDGSSAAEGVCLYVNGVKVDDANSNVNGASYVAMEPLTSPLHIGRYDDDYSSGHIGDVVFYEGVLTADEVVDAYSKSTYQEIDANNSVVWLPLRSRFNDGSNEVTRNIGTGADAIVGDGSTSETYPTFVVPHGAYFAKGDYLKLPANTVSVSGESAVTVGCLIKVDEFTDDYARMISQADDVTDRFILGYGGAAVGNVHRLTCFIGSGYGVTNVDVLESGTYCTVFLVYDGSGSTNEARAKLYYNGELQTTGFVSTIPATVPTIADDMYVAYSNVTANREFVGTIMFPCVFKEAFTPRQIKYLHNKMMKELNR